MEAIVILENLVTEFYSHTITNQRRQEIEISLLAFENRTDSWKDCLHYILNYNNILVCSFCVKVLETIIVKHWSKLCQEEKTELQNSLSNYLLSDTNIPLPISKHIIKLITIIARNEWPSGGTNFISNIVDMILLDDTKMVLVGLSSLQIASEELISPREDMCTDRKVIIKQNFEAYIPKLFSLLYDTFRKYKHTDAEEKIYESVLNALLQLYSWVPLSDVYTTELLAPVFECSVSNNPQINILALTVLNEILYKNCVPNKCIPLILSICYKLNNILLHITQNDIRNINEDYIAKILEMVSLLFSLHWHRIESNTEPNQIISFLSSFFKLSFHQISLQCYYTCLEIWCSFLEYLIMRNINHIKQYENILFTLFQEMIKKLHSKINSENKIEYMEEIEESSSFLNQHMNVIDSLIELIPERTIAFLFGLWHAVYVEYTKLLNDEQYLIQSSERIYPILRNFEVAIQILTSSYSKIDGNAADMIRRNLFDLTILINIKRLHKRNELINISADLLRVHCELLSVLPMWICTSFCENDGLIASIFSTTIPLVEAPSSEHPKLQVAASRLITRTVGYVKEVNLLQPLFVDPSFKHLPLDAQRLLQCALCCWVCLCKSEPYGERLKFLRTLFETVTLKKVENFNDLTVILKECRIMQTEGKELLFAALEPWLEFVIEEYPRNLVNNPQMCDVLITFFLEAFRILWDSMKMSVIEKLLVMLNSCFLNVTKIPLEGYGLDKIISFFILLSECPTFNKAYISGIIDISKHIFLQAVKEQNPILADFYKLFRCILLNKWLYFYKGRNQANGKSELSCKDEFETILSMILESFKHTDVSIYRSNLQFIEEVNMKCDLYNKDIFRTKYLPLYLNALMNTLIGGSLKLLADEILAAVYHMAAVNFDIFFDNYVPLFLVETDGLSDVQKSALKSNVEKQTDMPSFVQTIARLINDIRSYKMENGYC